jgi:CheY-like chemotaxis protein
MTYRCVTRFRAWERIHRPWDHQLIVGISEHANLNDEGRAQAVGMDAFYPKPITAKAVSMIQASSDFALRAEKLEEREAIVLHQPNGDSDSTSTRQDSREPLDVADMVLPVSSPFNAVSRPLTQAPVPSPICLIALSERTTQPDPIPQLLESKGWKVITISDGPGSLKLLQVRIWDAVLIDDDLPQMGGVACITMLRQWEKGNRASGQRNVFLVCDGLVPSPTDENSRIQPPKGCNGVLSRPVPLSDFEYLVRPKV